MSKLVMTFDFGVGAAGDMAEDPGCLPTPVTEMERVSSAADAVGQQQQHFISELRLR